MEMIFSDIKTSPPGTATARSLPECDPQHEFALSASGC
jgi:hypothetical protein